MIFVARTLLLSHTSLSRHSLMPFHWCFDLFSPTHNKVSLKQTYTTASHRGSLIAQTPQATALHGVLRCTHALARLMRTFSLVLSERRYGISAPIPRKMRPADVELGLLEPPSALTRSTASIVIAGPCVRHDGHCLSGRTNRTAAGTSTLCW